MSGSIQLKRTLTVKVVVTEAFKNYLSDELNRSLLNLDQQLAQLEKQAEVLMESFKASSGDKAPMHIERVKQQLELDKQQQKLAKEDILKKMREAKQLQVGSEFNQGTVDGWVEVQVGDNLYEKIGGLEILAKDGIIQSFRQIK